MFRRRNNTQLCGPFTVQCLTLFDLLYIGLIPLQTRDRKETKWGRCSASPKITIRVVLVSGPHPPPLSSFKANTRFEVVQQFILLEKKTRNIISSGSKHNTWCRLSFLLYVEGWEY